MEHSNDEAQQQQHTAMMEHSNDEVQQQQNAAMMEHSNDGTQQQQSTATTKHQFMLNLVPYSPSKPAYLVTLPT